ncbi:MAG: NAD(P)-dependent oxidoreductase [Acetobacterales bacterium]
MTERTVGFVGVGDMGGPMTRRLLDAGFGLVVHDIREDRLAPLVQQGARAVDSPVAVASETDMVFVSLPTPDVVEKVALGDDGLIAGSAIRSYIDLSTTGAVMSKRVAAALKAKGIETLDSPVSGGSTGAGKGTLALMCAGPRSLYEAAGPALDVLGKRFYVGAEPGLGQTMKVCNNFLSAIANIATGEAMVLGTKAGLDPQVMIDVLNASSGRNSATEDKFPRCVLPGTFGSGFTVRLLHKDVELCMDEAASLDVPMWMGASVRQFLAFALSQGMAEQNTTRLVTLPEKWAGVEVRSRPRKAAE